MTFEGNTFSDKEFGKNWDKNSSKHVVISFIRDRQEESLESSIKECKKRDIRLLPNFLDAGSKVNRYTRFFKELHS